VLKKGGKGRISNELVAASCAAIIAVYAAGTWRTRDADRRFGVQGEMRRPARPAQAPAVSIPAAVAAAVSQAVPAALPAAVEPRVIESPPAPKKPVQVDAAPSPAAVLPQVPAPESPAVAAAVEAKPEPAPEDVVATGEAEAASSRTRWLDGYYTGWGTSRHGDIQAFVRIENNRIIDAGVASCETRWPCDVIDLIIRQPIERQSAEVDRVSRATASADAYYLGLVTALEHAEAGTFKSIRP
jgi:uncharacterized protein with FMN-binding domain